MRLDVDKRMASRSRYCNFADELLMHVPHKKNVGWRLLNIGNPLVGVMGKPVVGDPRVVAENSGVGAPSTKMAMFSMKSYRLTGTQGLLPGGC